MTTVPNEINAAAVKNSPAEKVTPMMQQYLSIKAEYPDMLARAQVELSPHQVAFYLRELAANLHSFYFAEKVLVEDAALMRARLALVVATRQVLRNGLGLIGVSAPDQM